MPQPAQPVLHRWDVTPAEAIAIQQRLREQVLLVPLQRPVSLIAGVDTGFTDQGATARAVIALYRYPELELVEAATALDPVRFPYVPGLLSFREIPVVLKALGQLSQQPDLLLCDGQGIAHPRRLGIATHLGLVTGIPSIGVGKSRLTGRYQEPGLEKGEQSPLLAGNERIGTVLRSRTGVRPLFVSPGHLVSHEDAVDWVMRCLTGYRLPEPIRTADRLASARQGSKTALL
ncbi:MAG TPA: deoxyribonuclease V [Gammaproteobacteria bacterium]|nr:deoxyribonuclease V [Gammaproteobacteria bacterium]